MWEKVDDYRWCHGKVKGGKLCSCGEGQVYFQEKSRICSGVSRFTSNR
jgi:hypothetical protein